MTEVTDDKGKNRAALAVFSIGCLLVLGIFGCGPFIASGFWLSGS